ncbi:MAG TPA: hypothetical protein VE913_10500 [Longimicrobium sp.]|nr:hypothetical protein [Longimicrobium sp.]
MSLPSLLALALSAAACERFAESPTEARMPDVSPYVTAELAAQLTADGRFRLPPPKAPDDVPIITEGRARELASAFLRTWGRMTIPRWAWERNAPIDPGGVSPAARVYYAETPHGRVPDDVYHPAIRRMYGPMYIVPLVSGSEVVAFLAVSAYSTDLRIDSDGTVLEPMLGGSYFFSAAVAPNPRDPRFHYDPVSSEEAVKRASELTGARVAEMPTLVLRHGYHPAMAQWRVKLDRPVRVRRQPSPGPKGIASFVPDDTPIPIRELYVGPNAFLSIPRAVQPNHLALWYTTSPGPRYGPEPHKKYDLPRRNDLPVQYDPVTHDKE